MAIYRIKDCCAICRSDCFGNKESGFLCRRCNILYRAESLRRKSMVPVQKKEAKPKSVEAFVGSVKSLKFHRMDCPFVLKIKKENLIHLKSKLDAGKLGYSACICMKV